MTSKSSKIVYVNDPEPLFRIEEVGESTPTTWEVDWEERQQPSAREFDRLGTAEVKLVVAGSDLPDELQAEFDAAHEALCDLQDAMLEHRGIDPDSDAGQEVRLGNLDGLPEVTRRDE